MGNQPPGSIPNQQQYVQQQPPGSIPNQQQYIQQPQYIQQQQPQYIQQQQPQYVQQQQPQYVQQQPPNLQQHQQPQYIQQQQQQQQQQPNIQYIQIPPQNGQQKPQYVQIQPQNVQQQQPQNAQQQPQYVHQLQQPPQNAQQQPQFAQQQYIQQQPSQNIQYIQPQQKPQNIQYVQQQQQQPQNLQQQPQNLQQQPQNIQQPQPQQQQIPQSNQLQPQYIQQQPPNIQQPQQQQQIPQSIQQQQQHQQPQNLQQQPQYVQQQQQQPQNLQQQQHQLQYVQIPQIQQQPQIIKQQQPQIVPQQPKIVQPQFQQQQPKIVQLQPNQLQFPHPYFSIDRKKDELYLGYMIKPTGEKIYGCNDYEYPKMSFQLYVRLCQAHPSERMNYVTATRGDKLNLALLLGWTDTCRDFINMLDKSQLKVGKHMLQAAQLQNLEVIRLLIEKGLDPMIMWKENSGVLVDMESVQVVTPYGQVKEVLVGGREFKGNHCLIYELSRKNAPHSLKYLLDYCVPKGFNVNDKWNWGRTPLVWACWLGAWENVPVLLDFGADPNIPDEYGKTPLQHCIFGSKNNHQGNVNYALLLVQRGANVTDKELEGVTGPLYQQLLQARMVFKQSNPQ